MPVFDTDLEQHIIDGTGYGFSATRIDELGASEYTLVGIAIDNSGSVYDFGTEIEACDKEIVKSCQHSPRADNLMLRMVRFNSRVEEVHGFKPLSECNVDDYTGVVTPGGMTALFDASVNVVEAVARYGKDLVSQDFIANGIVFVVTDGDDNDSTATVKMLGETIKRATRGEALESLVTVLVGVNTDAQTGLNAYLERIARDAGFTQYVAIAKADARTLAKLADFVSRSISSQSQALGTGGASQSLSF
jgi:uncharacterized protein YegL